MLIGMDPPGSTALATMRECKARHPSVEFLMCSVPDNADGLFDAVRAGALGFLASGATSSILVRAIKDLHAGGSPLSPGIARHVLAHIGRPREQPTWMALLSTRERQVLEHLAKGHRYKEIAVELHLSIETVRTHIRNLYDKLHVSSRTDALNKLYPR